MLSAKLAIEINLLPVRKGSPLKFKAHRLQNLASKLIINNENNNNLQNRRTGDGAEQTPTLLTTSQTIAMANDGGHREQGWHSQTSLRWRMPAAGFPGRFGTVLLLGGR